VGPILKVIGELPPGTPAAFEAAFGTSGVVELLEDYGFTLHPVHAPRCKAIASARLKNDKVDAATLAQLLRADLRGSHRSGRPAAARQAGLASRRAPRGALSARNRPAEVTSCDGNPAAVRPAVPAVSRHEPDLARSRT
jgi:hypothetical protein